MTGNEIGEIKYDLASEDNANYFDFGAMYSKISSYCGTSKVNNISNQPENENENENKNEQNGISKINDLNSTSQNREQEKSKVHSKSYISSFQCSKSYFEFLARSTNLGMFNNLSIQLAIDELERKLKFFFWFRLVFSLLCYLTLFVHSL